MTALWIIVLCGALAVAFAIWAIQSVMSADAGSARMQEISAAVREGAQAYLKRQYSTIARVGIVIFLLVGYFLGWLVAVGFAIGALLSGLAGFIGMNVSV
ncbi:MAG: sodium/proton-translocating pyrophosphatase, partial [Bradyrhizobiaceae bacterium]|nr:sodium/proton-translocating pyrophosphatase [Bradyrhizobiaceae bacterium]